MSALQLGKVQEIEEVCQNVLRSLARTAGFLAYVLSTLEMIFMVTPFALYYYSAYAPLLSAPSKLRATAWLAAFFLPHLSRESVPSAGGLIFLAGLVGFLVGALQIYYAKFRHRGVVKHWFYKWDDIHNIFIWPSLALDF